MYGERETLKAELEVRTKQARRVASLNTALVYCLGFAAVLSSIAGSISLALDLLPKVVNITLAAIPGIAVSLRTYFRFEERSSWWWTNYDKFDSLRRGLLYEQRSEKDMSQELTSFRELHGRLYPKFVKHSTSGKRSK
jgi:hypothetical protein